MSTIATAGNDGHLSWSINLTGKLSSFILRYEERIVSYELRAKFMLQVGRYSKYNLQCN